MPFVRKEETEEELRDALALVDEGALHQGIAILVSVARRVARAGKRPEIERAAAAIEELLARPANLGMTSKEDAELTQALSELRRAQDQAARGPVSG